ncbi:MAG: HNH endonuclease [Chromatiaceae bacterium]|nr:HNH endonuclease [Chromatiaceae bacterium]
MPKIKSTTPAPELTAERARALLSYNPLTGELHWLKSGTGRKPNLLAGGKHPDGYTQTSIDNRKHLNHRIAWLIAYGDWPSRELDHINGVKNDNRLANLREVSRTTNCENQLRARADNMSCGLLGVYAKKGVTRVRNLAYIQVNGKRVHLGSFATPEEAHQVYLAAKRRLHAGNTL